MVATPLFYKEETEAHRKFTFPRVFIATRSFGKRREKAPLSEVWGGMGAGAEVYVAVRHIFLYYVREFKDQTRGVQAAMIEGT